MENKIHIMPDFCNRQFPFHYTTALNILMKMGIDICKVNILANGEYENYKGEVREQNPAAGTEVGMSTKITLKIGLSSAVDYMPYQFFYGLFGTMQSGRGWEDRARRLMAPFDAAVARHDATARYQILKYDGGIVEEEYLRRVLELYGFTLPDSVKDIGEIIFLFSIFPSFNYWAGNPLLVEQVLQFFFKYRFKIVENSKSEYEIPDSIRYQLGTKSGRLGKETIVGRLFAECDSSYDVVISGVKANEVPYFQSGKPLRNKLDWILNFCMPGNLNAKIKIKVNTRKTRVGNKSKNCYLGYSSFI
jgi:hypothetical protein